jgi:hypothetical protein
VVPFPNNLQSLEKTSAYASGFGLILARRICFAAKMFKAFHVNYRLIRAAFIQLHDVNSGEAWVQRASAVPSASKLTTAAPPAIIRIDFDGNSSHKFSPVMRIIVGATDPK